MLHALLLLLGIIGAIALFGWTLIIMVVSMMNPDHNIFALLIGKGIYWGKPLDNQLKP